MSSRETILNAVRQHHIACKPLPDIPDFAVEVDDPLAAFSTSLQLMGGTADRHFIDQPLDRERLTAYVRSLFPEARVFCSATDEVQGDRTITSDCSPASLHDVDVGIARARFGVIETGSVYFSEQELCVNALGYLAQHMVVLLDSHALVVNLHQAYKNPHFLRANYSVLVSGPSATADIEGVLITGAQGVRSLRVIFY
ncbi:L-lactate dehydrogenase complex protein LldG [Izhakiella capsodis]|uniref:L-lactate dehydrogenase complex protein LldG n=1 Tax=Izhakiella capsodis TaxID=1367852 RepID=A0A1I4WY53_9GAMM|nr:LUD domain-containing protein [Izhakiella capsodis]SFN18497.1 L-lactate dehydrogenase complex protein LldG [Izhakiella capsodis]